MLRKQNDVRLTLRQIRHRNRENVQTVEQVFAELALRNQLFKIAASCSQKTNIGMKFFVAAHATKGTFLQKAQELYLCLHRQITNFVEEERTPVGGFSTTDTAIDSTRKGTLFVTKKFTFYKVFWQSGTVERNKRLVLSFRQIYDCTGNHFLTRTATATN